MEKTAHFYVQMHIHTVVKCVEALHCMSKKTDFLSCLTKASECPFRFNFLDFHR